MRRGHSGVLGLTLIAGCGVFSGLDDLEVTSEPACATADCAPGGLAEGGTTSSPGSSSAEGGSVDGAKGDASAECPCAGGCLATGACRKVVFVTSTVHAGLALGGISGADAICAARAAAGGLAGTYKAWLADDENREATEPRARLARSTTPYVRRDRVEVATDFEYLFAKADRDRLEAPINVTELGETITGTCDVWTGIKDDGHASGSCDGWAGQGVGLAGSCTRTDDKWTDDSPSVCTAALHLYCFEQ